jgi:UDP:flavonoid glycosyltransferase YjiC (YdhE family)
VAEILIAACLHPGHVAPLLTVARGLVARGHDVTFPTSSRHVDEVRAAGATPHQAGVLGGLAAARRFDVIIADGSCPGVLPTSLRDDPSRPPVLAYTGAPLAVTRRIAAPAAAASPLGRPCRRAGESLCKALGLREHPARVPGRGVLGDRLIVASVPEFDYHRAALPESVRFVGVIRPEPADNYIAPRWWRELSADRPVVYVSQSTRDDADPGGLIERTIEALGQEDLTVVVTTGAHRVPRVPRALPSNTFVTDFIPHDLLLPSVDLVITNGGYGGVQRALTCGVPLVVAGNADDELEVARRVEWFGAGVNLRTRVPSASSVRHAVREVLAHGSYRTAARTLQRAYEVLDGVDEIAKLVDEVVAERSAGARHA